MAAQSMFQDVRTWGSAHMASRNWLESIMFTDDSSTLVIARVFLALVIFPHGAQKVLGWYGGFGLTETMGFFQQLGISPTFAGLAIAAEFLGAIFLLFGLFARVASFGLLCTLLVALFRIHLRNGFFMNWNGSQLGEGIEFHLLAIALTLIVFIGGAGSWSCDRAIYRKTRGV